jgi:uncharacterized damage-inducible protein DinB
LIIGNGYPQEKERKEALEQIDSSYDNAKKYLLKMDGEMDELIDKITDKLLKTIGKNIRIYDGRTIDLSVWEYLMQHIIHQTHHRGQLVQIFDEMKIESNIGNIFPFIRDSVKG